MLHHSNIPARRVSARIVQPRTAAAAALTALLVIPAACPAQGGANTLRLGWTAWASSEATARVAAHVLRERLGYHVETVLATTPFLYSALANGDLDLFLASWQPDAHRDLLRAVGDRVADFGILYAGAKLGWAVPTRVTPATISEIPDLRRPRVRRMLGATIRGVDAGTGIVRVSERALETYGLTRYTLKPSSDAGAAAAIKRALRQEKPVVVTARRPHWLFRAHDLRYLDDPKAALGGLQRVHKLTRTDFTQTHPWASKMIERMTLPKDHVRRIMATGRERSYRAAAERYVRRHPARIHYWVTGEMPSPEGG